MKLSRDRIRNGVITSAFVLLIGGGAATVSRAQEEGRTPPSESPKSETPSAPAESPRSDPSSSSSPSSGSSSSSSSSSSNDNSSRGSDSGNSASSNDSAGSSGRSRGDDSRKGSKNDGSGKDRRSSNGTGNGRERVMVNKVPVTATIGNDGANNGRGRDRDRDRVRDRDRDRDRGRDGRPGHDRHRHRDRSDACYQVPIYDDTTSYQSGNYGKTDDPYADTMSAYERGYQGGLYTGANDGRRKQTYDPERSHFYNDTPGYDPVFGGRDAYQQAYRDGFLHGYREGFQNWQKYFAGGVFHK